MAKCSICKDNFKKNSNVQKYCSGCKTKYAKLYSIWLLMRNCRNYKYATPVCVRWNSFANFLKDMERGYKPGLTIERVNNRKGYTPSNCVWATRMEQANNRSSNRWVTIGERTQTLEQWIREFGLKSSTVRQRIYVYRWPVLKALEVHHS